MKLYRYTDIEKFPTEFGTLYFGPAPNQSKLEQLKDLGVEVIWNLGLELEEELALEQEMFNVVIHSKIRDYSVPKDMENFAVDLYFIREALRLGKICFVHCLGGHGRTGLALACLSILEGKTAQEALELSKLYCFGPENESQIDFVYDFFDTRKVK